MSGVASNPTTLTVEQAYQHLDTEARVYSSLEDLKQQVDNVAQQHKTDIAQLNNTRKCIERTLVRARGEIATLEASKASLLQQIAKQKQGLLSRKNEELACKQADSETTIKKLEALDRKKGLSEATISRLTAELQECKSKAESLKKELQTRSVQRTTEQRQRALASNVLELLIDFKKTFPDTASLEKLLITHLNDTGLTEIAKCSKDSLTLFYPEISKVLSEAVNTFKGHNLSEFEQALSLGIQKYLTSLNSGRPLSAKVHTGLVSIIWGMPVVISFILTLMKMPELISISRTDQQNMKALIGRLSMVCEQISKVIGMFTVIVWAQQRSYEASLSGNEQTHIAPNGMTTTFKPLPMEEYSSVWKETTTQFDAIKNHSIEINNLLKYSVSILSQYLKFPQNSGLNNLTTQFEYDHQELSGLQNIYRSMNPRGSSVLTLGGMEHKSDIDWKQLVEPLDLRLPGGLNQASTVRKLSFENISYAITGTNVVIFIYGGLTAALCYVLYSNYRNYTTRQRSLQNELTEQNNNKKFRRIANKIAHNIALDILQPKRHAVLAKSIEELRPARSIPLLDSKNIYEWLSDLGDTVSDLEAVRDKLNQASGTTHDAEPQTDTRLENKLDTLENLCKQLSQRINSLKERNRQFNTQRQSLTKHLSRLTEVESNLRTEIERLTRASQQNDNPTPQFARSQTELQGIKATLNELHTDVKNAEAEISTLDDQVELAIDGHINQLLENQQNTVALDLTLQNIPRLEAIHTILSSGELSRGIEQSALERLIRRHVQLDELDLVERVSKGIFTNYLGQEERSQTDAASSYYSIASLAIALRDAKRAISFNTNPESTISVRHHYFIGPPVVTQEKTESSQQAVNASRESYVTLENGERLIMHMYPIYLDAQHPSSGHRA